MDIIAHRGASHDAPENTLAAFRLGWEQHADAVELDVWLTKDGRLIASHDPNTRRATGQDWNISGRTLAELRTLDAGSWKGPQWKDERLPSLEDVLALLPDDRRLVIEIKCGVEALPELQRVVKASGKRCAQLVLISFHYDVCVLAQKLFPKNPVLLLASFRRNWVSGIWTPRPEELLRKAKAAGLAGVNLSSKGPLNAALVKKAHAAGLKFYVWTVDSVRVARKLRAAGVDGITTNRPGWLREQLQ